MIVLFVILYHLPPIFFPFYCPSLLFQSLFLPFSVLFVTPPAINIISSRFLLLTDSSQFTIFRKFCFTSNSFPLLYLSARCLLSSFFFPLDVPSLRDVPFAVPPRLFSFPLRRPRFISPNDSSFHHSLPLLQFFTIKIFFIRCSVRHPIPSFSNSYSRLIVLSLVLSITDYINFCTSNWQLKMRNPKWH